MPSAITPHRARSESNWGPRPPPKRISALDRNNVFRIVGCPEL
jgi:hypothetical protein